MRKIRLIAVFALLTVCATSFAQFTNSSSSSSSTASSDEWNTFWVEWNPSTFDPSKGDGQSFTGFSAGVSHAFSLSSSSPLFIEGGIGVQYSFYSEDMDDYYDEYTQKVNMFSIKAPINFVYRYNLPNSNFSLCPFAGITLRYNLSGKLKYESDDEDDDWGYEDSDDNERNLFDKDEMDGNPYKRFQIGWQIGAKAIINNKVSLGVSYGSDFSEIQKKVKIKTTSISLGFIF